MHVFYPNVNTDHFTGPSFDAAFNIKFLGRRKNVVNLQGYLWMIETSTVKSILIVSFESLMSSDVDVFAHSVPL